MSARALKQNYIQGSSFQSHNYADVGCKDAQNATRTSWKEQIMILLKLETLSASVAARKRIIENTLTIRKVIK